MITADGVVKNMTGEMSRLVHDGKSVLAIIEGTDKTITTTIHDTEEFKTESESIDRISVLKLLYQPIELKSA